MNLLQSQRFDRSAKKGTEDAKARRGAKNASTAQRGNSSNNKEEKIINNKNQKFFCNIDQLEQKKKRQLLACYYLFSVT